MPTFEGTTVERALIEETRKADLLTAEEALEVLREEIALRRSLEEHEADRFAVAIHPEDY